VELTEEYLADVEDTLRVAFFKTLELAEKIGAMKLAESTKGA
jgi:hypothetical protein